MDEDDAGTGCSALFVVFIIAGIILIPVPGVIKAILLIALTIYIYILVFSNVIEEELAVGDGIIAEYEFPGELLEKLTEKYPHLTKEQAARVVAGLKEYFHICNHGKGRMVAMPSQAVDVVWHEFILYTKKYEEFCNNAFGRFLHHTPAQAMSSPVSAQEGIERAWSLSCAREDISPVSAHKLPILFALDVELDIPDGFKYSLDCSADNDSNFCAAHIPRKSSDIPGVRGACSNSGF